MSILKIKSKRVELPPIYLIENEEDFKQLPRGLPYVYGSQKELSFITIFLEFQVLYRSCIKTGIPVKWLDCLNKLGYKNHKTYALHSGGDYFESSEGNREISVDEFVEDHYLVNFDKLSELKVIPKWLDDIKLSVETNIIDEVTFDPMAFNKQLGMHVGAGAVAHQSKNLIILDVSGSIPTSIVKSITLLAKLMSKKFYADIMITSGKTVLIDYEDVDRTDIVDVARKSGGGNEGKMYFDIIKEPKEYNTIICFGDDDSPQGFSNIQENTFNEKCKFKVETLYSLHTEWKTSKNLAGYCKAFNPKTVNKVSDWTTTLV